MFVAGACSIAGSWIFSETVIDQVRPPKRLPGNSTGPASLMGRDVGPVCPKEKIMEGVNGANPVNATEDSRGTKVDSTPPKGQPVGAPKAEPEAGASGSGTGEAEARR